MGGHGAWHLATHFPDKALAAVPLAGWIKKEEYGDSNLFFRCVRRQQSFLLVHIATYSNLFFRCVFQTHAIITASCVFHFAVIRKLILSMHLNALCVTSNYFLCIRHDVSTSHVEPGVKAVLESCITENEVDRLVSNLKVSK